MTDPFAMPAEPVVLQTKRPCDMCVACIIDVSVPDEAIEIVPAETWLVIQKKVVCNRCGKFKKLELEYRSIIEDTMRPVIVEENAGGASGDTVRKATERMTQVLSKWCDLCWRFYRLGDKDVVIRRDEETKVKGAVRVCLEKPHAAWKILKPIAYEYKQRKDNAKRIDNTPAQ